MAFMSRTPRQVQVEAIMSSLLEMLEELDDGQLDSMEDIIVNHCGEDGANLFREFILCRGR